MVALLLACLMFLVGAPQLERPASPLPLDLTALVPGTDSFTVMVNGLPLGWTRTTVTNTAEGKRLSEQSNIGGLVEQTTTVDISASGAMLRVRQSGQNQGQPTSIELDYHGTHVTGKATAGSADSAKIVPVDTTLGENPIDDNALQGLLAALPWTSSARWTFLTFSGGQNEGRMTTLTVVGTEPVTIPSGTVEAFKVEWSGGWQPALFWITAKAPFRLVKIGVVGTPVEVILGTRH